MSGGLQPQDAAGPGEGDEAPIIVDNAEDIEGLAEDVEEVVQDGGDQGDLITAKERTDYLSRLVHAGTANADLVQRVWQVQRDLEVVERDHDDSVIVAAAKWEALKVQYTTKREEEFEPGEWWHRRLQNLHLRCVEHHTLSSRFNGETDHLVAQESRAARHLEYLATGAAVLGKLDRLGELRRYSDHSAEELSEVTKHVILLELEVDNHCWEVKEAGALKVLATRRLNLHLGRSAVESAELLRLRTKHDLLREQPYNDDVDSDIGELTDEDDDSSDEDDDSDDDWSGSSELEELHGDELMEGDFDEGEVIEGDIVEDDVIEDDVAEDDIDTESRPSTSQR